MSNFDNVADLAIIGAGIYGICAANTYLSLFPLSDVVIFETGTDVGGVWSASRTYPGFWSQTGTRLAGYSDEDFVLPRRAQSYFDLFEAKHLSQYLEDYVDSESYAGRSLRERFLLCALVNKLEKKGEYWRVHAKVSESKTLSSLARKVIVATGLNSEPFMPEFAGQEEFDRPIIHQKELGRSRILGSSSLNPESNRNITILGGSKSASDMAYAAATDAHSRVVNWIIRTSGNGPTLLTNVKAFGKYRNLPETGSTRLIASVSSANPYAPEGWWSWVLHKTTVGEWLLDKIWSRGEVDSAQSANFHERAGALPGYEGLKSASSIRWRTGPIGLRQREDFWDVVARNVRVYRSDVERMEEGCIVLADGRVVDTDVLLCGTGWKVGYPFFCPDEMARLGLPIDHDNQGIVEEERQHWSSLDKTADHKVLATWPTLKHVASGLQKRSGHSTPYRLYNGILPVRDHSIAFLGTLLVPNSFHAALAQSLFAIAAMEAHVDLPDEDKMKEQVAFMTAWCARRYPVHGWLGNAMDYEMVSYTDHLLGELGLGSHRKGNWWSDWTDPCLATDYATVVDEYKRKYLGSNEDRSSRSGG